MKVKFVLADMKHLSKKTFGCNVPADMHWIAKKIKKDILVGVGKWSNKDEWFIAVFSKKMFFITPELLEKIRKFYENEGGD